jgi:uroporphyrin-3 C-methyltransferase/uroporphyrinogen III methyltransferase/synthase
VHEVSQPDALLLTPSQAYFVRENLKLRLLNARLALMSRNETAFRTDLSLTKEWLMRYFDVRTPSVQQTHAQLNTLANASLSISMPTLAESLALVRKLSDNANPQSGKK